MTTTRRDGKRQRPARGSGNDVVREEGGVARGSVIGREFVRERERVSGRVGEVTGGHRWARD